MQQSSQDFIFTSLTRQADFGCASQTPGLQQIYLSFAFSVRHILQVSQHKDRFALVYALELVLKAIRLVLAN